VRAPSPSQIKARVESGDHRYFFTRDTMRFFGDSMRNFGSYRDAEGRVWLYRKRPVKHGLTGRWLYDEAKGRLTKDEGNPLVRNKEEN